MKDESFVANNQQFPLWKKAILWENGLGGSGGLKRIFFPKCTNFKQKNQKKSVSICSIRPIRSPIVSLSQSRNYLLIRESFLF
jgi:hypothetical protein